MQRLGARHVGGATVTELDCVFVADLVQSML